MGHCGHGGHGDHVAQFRRLFWVNLVLAVPVVAFSPMFAMILGYSVPGWATWIAPVIGTVMYVWGGSPFLKGTVSEIKARKPGMMLLIALGITVAFLASWGATLGLLHHELEFWWELALLVVIMLLGHWIEMRSLAQTTSALDSLAALLPDEAERVEGETAVTVSPAELRVDDLVIVRPGGSVPADGMIVDGRAAMDESMITGESHPATRSEGDAVTAGTVATDSALRVRVTAIGDDTTLAGINRLVADAQNSSSRAQRIADRAAGWLFWFALAQSDVGVAIGAGTDVAIASAGVILASSDPRSVLSVIELSRAAYRKMKQNRWWAAGYNLISVPLAAGVLARVGFVLPMSVGAILMSLSTIVVALNAQLLRRIDLSPEASTRAVLERTN